MLYHTHISQGGQPAVCSSSAILRHLPKTSARTPIKPNKPQTNKTGMRSLNFIQKLRRKSFSPTEREQRGKLSPVSFLTRVRLLSTLIFQTTLHNWFASLSLRVASLSDWWWWWRWFHGSCHDEAGTGMTRCQQNSEFRRNKSPTIEAPARSRHSSTSITASVGVLEVIKPIFNLVCAFAGVALFSRWAGLAG